MNDEKLYLEATNEVEGENRDPALWAKAITLCDGDETKAKYEYIRSKVKNLQEISEDLITSKHKPDTEKAKKEEVRSQPAANKMANSDEELMKKYNISLDGDDYQHESKKYKKLSKVIEDVKSKKLRILKDRVYVPVDIYAYQEKFYSGRLLELINEGIYEGKLIENEWYIAVEVVKKNRVSEPKSVPLKKHIETNSSVVTGGFNAFTSALLWASILALGSFAGYIVVIFIVGTGDIGGLIAKKLFVVIGLFLILFSVLWIWGAFSRKDPMLASATGSNDAKVNKKLSKWNYVGVGVGLFMLMFLFTPKLISGELENQFYLGAAFWVGVIIYCSLNIYRAMQCDKPN